MPGPESSPLYEQNIAPEQPERKPVEKEDKMEEPAIRKLDVQYETKDSIDRLLESFQKDQKKIQELRQAQGIGGDTELPVLGGQNFEELIERKQEVEERIEDLERNVLGVPDDLEGNPSNRVAATESPSGFEGISSTENSNEDEMKKQRELYVQKFIEDSVKGILEEFKSFIDESENADNARELIALKINHEVGEAAKGYIEEGGESNFGFEIELDSLEHDTSEGEKRKFITEITIKITGEKINTK